MTVPWLSRLVVGPSKRKHSFDPKSGEQSNSEIGFLSEHFCRQLSISLHQQSVLSLIYMLLLLDQWKGEDSKPSTKEFSFRKSGKHQTKVIPLLSALKSLTTKTVLPERF